MPTNLPPTPTISPDTFNKNFEIVILFNVVERSGNYAFEDNPPPPTPWVRVVNYAMGTFKVYIERVII